MSFTIPLRAGFSVLALVAIGAVVVSTLSLADGRLDETDAASAAAERLRHSLLLDDIVEAEAAVTFLQPADERVLCRDLLLCQRGGQGDQTGCRHHQGQGTGIAEAKAKGRDQSQVLDQRRRARGDANGGLAEGRHSRVP